MRGGSHSPRRPGGFVQGRGGSPFGDAEASLARSQGRTAQKNRLGQMESRTEPEFHNASREGSEIPSKVKQ